MSSKIAKFFATFGYVGHIPLAPGSMASAMGMLLYIILYGAWGYYVAFFVFLTVLGFLVSEPVEKLMNQKDPSCIVIDEVSGAMIAFFLLPMIPSVMITTFFLFRAFDMFKIYPINKLEKIPGGCGVMMDDIVAGLYTNVIMQISIRLVGLI